LHCIILDRIGTVPQIESIRIDSNAADEKVVPVAALEIIVSRAALQHIWKDASAACAAANDTDSYAKIKAAVSERLKVLPEAA